MKNCFLFLYNLFCLNLIEFLLFLKMNIFGGKGGEWVHNSLGERESRKMAYLNFNFML